MTQHAPLIIDIEGLSLTKEDRRRLKNPLTGGIMGKSHPAHQPVRSNKRHSQRPADLRRPRRRACAAL